MKKKEELATLQEASVAFEVSIITLRRMELKAKGKRGKFLLYSIREIKKNLEKAYWEKQHEREKKEKRGHPDTWRLKPYEELIQLKHEEWMIGMKSMFRVMI